MSRKLDTNDETVFLVSTRIPSQIDTDLRETARRQGLPPSAVVRRALVWYLQAATQPNPQVKEVTP